MSVESAFAFGIALMALIGAGIMRLKTPSNGVAQIFQEMYDKNKKEIGELREQVNALKAENETLRRDLAGRNDEIESLKKELAWVKNIAITNHKAELRANAVSRDEVATFVKWLAAHFTTEELKTLVVGFGLRGDEIRGETNDVYARELAAYMKNRGRLEELRMAAQAERPDV